MLNTSALGSRARRSITTASRHGTSRRCCRSCRAAAPGGIVVGGGTTTTGAAAITSAGPNNAANVWNRRNLFTYTDTFRSRKGRHQISAACGSSACRTTKTRHRERWARPASQLDNVSAGHGDVFPSGAEPERTRLAQSLRRLVLRGHDPASAESHVAAGLRHEFTTGWNEVSGRAANYVTDANGVLVTDRGSASSVFTENQCEALFGPRVASGVGSVREMEDRDSRGLRNYYTLIDDLSFLLNSLPPYNGAASYAEWPCPPFADRLRRCSRPLVRSRRAAPCTTLRRRAFSRMRRRRRSRNGISGRTATHQAVHGAARRVCGIVRISRALQHRSE